MKSHHSPNKQYARELNTFLRASNLIFKFLRDIAVARRYVVLQVEELCVLRKAHAIPSSATLHDNGLSTA